MAFRSVRITFTNEDGNSKQVTFKQEVGKPITIPPKDTPVPVKQETTSTTVRVTSPEVIGNQSNQPMSYLQAAIQPFNDGRFSQTIDVQRDASPTTFYDKPKPDYSQGSLDSPAFAAGLTRGGRSAEASMGGGYTQNIQVKDSSTGQMITQVVTQEMINSNPSLARFYAVNGYITSDQWQQANGNTTGRFPTGRAEF